MRNAGRVLAGILLACAAPAQHSQLLWTGAAPGALGTGDADVPAITIYLPSSPDAAGTGVVVCPGGGYGALAMDHEGRQVAQWLNSHGIAALILKYRLGPRYHYPAQLQDAQRAIRFARFHARRFGLDPQHIGIWGFSAGGHLASTVGTHFHTGDSTAADPMDRLSDRPDFLILAYPVISLTTEYTHRGSLKNLLGDNPDPKLAEFLSSEKQVTAQTPPTFLFHTNADTSVPPENSVLFYLALRRAGVPAEMHIYQEGKHGVGLAPSDPALSTWPDRLLGWLRVRGLVSR